MDLGNVSSFGGIDADADLLLNECFQDHGAYLDARRHERFLIVGRKGSGKTAIFKRLISERSYDLFSDGHTFDDYPWHHHDLQAQTGVPEERRYIQSWKYLMLLSLAKIALNQDQSLSIREESLDSLEVIESFVVDSYGSRNPDLTQLFSPNKEIKLKGGLRTPLAVLDIERIRVKDLPIHIQEVNRKLAKHIMQSLNPGHDYYICFDQLDLGFNPDDQAYHQRLIGLILASRELNRIATEHGKRASVVVFLRDDIYQMLHFEDKNKLTENHMSKIEWKEYGKGLTLKSLMERRFGQVLNGEGVVPWESVFNEEREMPNRKTKYSYICDRTFLRPRDMIKFCNQVLMGHRELDADPDEKFDNEHVLKARPSYSEYLRNELDDEIAKQVPNYKEYLEVVKSVGAMQFTSTSFDASWKKVGMDRLGKSKEALRDLFEFSVVGYLKPGGQGGGSQYVWRYSSGNTRFNPEADTFRIHPGLKEVLDLVAGTGRGN